MGVVEEKAPEHGYAGKLSCEPLIQLRGISKQPLAALSVAYMEKFHRLATLMEVCVGLLNLSSTEETMAVTILWVWI